VTQVSVAARALPLVALEHVTKAYPGVLACDDVSLELRAGEVHGLLGENGAGKTTLMGILYGLHRPDAGRILVDGREAAVGEPRDAMGLGIGYVQQHFSLIPTLTVTENLILAMRFGGRRLSRREGGELIRELSDRYGLDVPADVRVDELSVGEQQRAELLKALAREPRALILDEPSALLSPQESQHLGEVIRRFAAEGMGVILISHKLEEVLAVVDRITVLRRGRLVRTLAVADASHAVLGRLMIGELAAADDTHGRIESPAGGSLLVLDDVWVDGNQGAPAVKGVSLDLRRGEILGIAGLEGSGQVELVEAVAGVRRAKSGTIRLDGADITTLSVRARQRRGIGHIPSDRRRDGLVGPLSVADNLALPLLGDRRFYRFGFLRRRAIRRHAQELIASFDVRVPSPDVPVSTLSGGNQQKVVVARELSRRPSVVLSCYPTWGLDFAAANAVHRELVRQRNEGAAVVVASMDLDELLGVADRIAVMQGGRVTGEVAARETTPERIGVLMGGAA
jgi:ABC-type uncharacterized transport system ATPase subunit